MTRDRLDEDEVTRLRQAVMLIARRLRTMSADEGLTPAQSGVLATLCREGPISAGALAAAEGLNPTMLSRICAHLEEGGLVERIAHPDDGRSTLVRPTTAGRRLLTRLRERRATLLVERLDTLSAAERRTLVDALPVLESLARGGPGG